MEITFANWKGGVGKTTLTLMLCAALKKAGHRAVIRDLDPQESAKFLGPKMGLDVIGVNGVTEDSAPIILTDTCPGADHESSLEAMVRADLLVIICSPSPDDLWATVRTAQAVAVRRDPNKPTRIFFNQVDRRSVLARDLETIKEQIGFPAFQNSLSRRQGYQRAKLEGYDILPGSVQNELAGVALEIIGTCIR